MRGIRLIAALVAVLLALVATSVALAAQDEGEGQGATSPAAEGESLPDRTADSETLTLPDGQLETRIYPEPVNYRDEEGNWHPIGERLHETGEQTLVNGPNAFDVTLPKQIDSRPVRFEVGDQWVESQLQRKDLEGAQLEGGSASYEGEGSAPSFEFTGLPNGLKEEIELSNPGQANTYTYELSASDGLEPSLADDGSVRFRDSEGNAAIVLPAPVMSDGAGAESRAVHYDLGPEEEGHWKLSVVADPEWLQQADRRFPVTIDPTMTVGTAHACVIGGMTGETGWIDCSSWGRKDLLVGYVPQLESKYDGWYRTLMELETTSIPVNSEITSATFNIHSLEVAKNTKGVELRKVTRPWNWEAAWSRYDGTHLWTTEGGDYSESLGEVLTANRGNQIGWWQFNLPIKTVEAEVNAKAWLSMIMKLIDDKVRECGKESCTERKIDFDSDHATTEANRPYLSVFYKAPTPIVTTEAPSALTETGATLKGQVNPHGYATTYQLEYGLTTSYGTKVPTTAESVGSGKTSVAVSKAISGLKGNTTYHYRVSATNAYGTSVGGDQAFTTPKLPSVTTEGSEAGTGSALISGSVNPNGFATTYQFEYGLSTSYGTNIPTKPGEAGSGLIAVNKKAFILSLTAGATYHYRITATNAAGTALGADKTFTTLNPPNTTITSAMPTYLSNEAPAPVKFESSQSGSTFKCSLDEEGVPKNACTSPYALPEHLSPGWHTFRVSAVNVKGEVDSTPDKYEFNPAIYPQVPPTSESKLVTPEDGEKSAAFYTLQAKWGNLPLGSLTGVTFQVKLYYWSEFRTIPASYVVDGKGQQVSWPLPIKNTPGKSEPVYFNARAYPAIFNESFSEGLKFRAIFDGSKKEAGASESVAAELSTRWSSPRDATEAIGPVSLDLLTGGYTLSRTDVSIPVPGSEANLEFTRVYESTYVGQKVPTQTLGGAWQPSAPVEREAEGEAWTQLIERHEDAVEAQYDPECIQEEEEFEEGTREECLVEEAIPAVDWVEVMDSEGAGISFEKVGENYISPDYAKEYVLKKEEGTFALTNPAGARTIFTQNGEGSGYYHPTSVSWQATAKSARMVYEFVNGTDQYRLTEMIGPAPSGVTCSEEKAATTPGCRSLTFLYSKGKFPNEDRLASISYHDASGSNSQVVAEYAYEAGHLTAEWDPRVSPCTEEKHCLKETYAYQGANLLESLTPPGQEPWKFAYSGPSFPRLKSVSRASLVESKPTATTSIAYEVPISGSGAPYDLSPASVAEWGQADYPVNATAIFPPSEVPSEPPSGYSKASVTYMDPDGYAVNTVSPQVPGVSGLLLSTTETDRQGNVVRSLSPQNRLLALAAGKESAARSHQLDSQATYSADGTEMLESLGPLHKVRLESGSTVEARARAKVEYDQGAPVLKEGETAPRLPTTETTSARTLSGEDLESRVTETHYDWTLRQPTETIVDPGKEHLELKTRIAYDKETGLPTERSLPAKPEGGDAHTTKTVYYTAQERAGHPCEKYAYAGLPCETMPAAQPAAEGQPELLVTKYKAYNGLDEPTEVIESPGGKEEKEKTRKTIKTYDEAGRPISSKQVGGGTQLPPTQTVYNEKTGLPVEQKFTCESECGAGFSYASAFGESGSATGQFNHPADIAIDAKGNLWVIDKANNRIEQFTEGGGSPKAFGSLGSTGGKLSAPSGIAIDPSGNVWVTDTVNTRVEEFNEKGEFVATFGTNVNKTKVESGGTQAEKNLCTAASKNVCQAGTAGSLEGQMKEPVGIAASSGGSLFVVEKGNGRVEKFSPSGELLAKFGAPGSGTGQFKEPTSVAVAPDGSLWVADSGNNRIQHWSSTLSLISAFGKEGTGNGEFKHPDAIEVDAGGNVLVADQGNARVQKLSSSGAFIARFGASEAGPGQLSLSDPAGIAVDAKGDALVTDPGHNQVQKWVPQTEFDSQAVVTKYDKLGRPEKYTDADGNSSEVKYDLMGRPASVNDGKGTQTFGYDETSGALVAMEDSAAGLFTASYNADGAMTEQGLPNGLVAKTTYDEAGQPTKLAYTKVTSCTEKCTWLEESQERSIYGQVLSQKSLTSSEQYSYDKAGRLTSAKETPTSGGCTTRIYAFEGEAGKDSNRTSLTTRAPVVGGACAESGGTTQSYKYDAADRLTGEGIEYDSFGRITSLPGTYAGGSTLKTSFYSNEMVASQSQGGLTNSYQLDATGRARQVTQTGSKEGTEVFHYSMTSDSTAWTERGSSWTRNISGVGGLGAIQSSTGETSLQLTNLHGDVVATASLSPTAKEPTAKFEFDEFGNSVKGSAGRYGWLGKASRRTELPSGAIQMGVRSYVPALGRFISVDPVPAGSANPYDYAFQDPVNALDLTGECGHRGEYHNCHPLHPHHHHGGHTTHHRPPPLITDHSITVSGSGITEAGGYIGASFTYKARESVSVSAYLTFRGKTSKIATASGSSGTVLINPVEYSGSVNTGEVMRVCVLAVGDNRSERKCYNHSIVVENWPIF